MAEKVDIIINAKDQATQQFSRTRQAVTGLTQSLTPLSLGLAGVATAAMLSTRKIIQIGSDAEETRSKFRAVFKDLSQDALTWAEDFSESVGRARMDVESWMARLQDTFVPLGFSREKALKLSQSLTKLAVDVASFNNASDPETIELFTSALVGNHEAVRRYGIVITEASLKQEAINQGIRKNYNDLTNLEKVQLRYNIIMRSSADAQGDAIRTAGSYANVTKRMNAELKELAESLSVFVLPTAAKLIGSFTTLVTKTNELVRGIEGMTIANKAFSEAQITMATKLEILKDTVVEYAKGILTGKTHWEALGDAAAESAQQNEDAWKKVLDLMEKAKETIKKPSPKEEPVLGLPTQKELETEAQELLRRQIEAYEQEGAALELRNQITGNMQDANIQMWQEYYAKQKEEYEKNISAIESYRDRTSEIYAEIGMKTAQSMGQALAEGKPVLKEGFKTLLEETIRYLEIELIAARVAAIIKTAMSGGVLAVTELAGLMASTVALEGLKAAFANYQQGIGSVTQAQLAYIHTGERVMSATENRGVIDALSRIEAKLGQRTGGDIYISAIDTMSFQEYMRRGGYAIMEQDARKGKLVL